MSEFGADKKHTVTFEVRGPKTRKQVKAYMKRVRKLLRGLPGKLQSERVMRAVTVRRRKRKSKGRKRRRRTS